MTRRHVLQKFGVLATLCTLWFAPLPARSQSGAPNAAVQAEAKPSNDYPLGPDSLPHPGTPHGQTFDFVIDSSKTFPNTSRKITVYVPAQYRESQPAYLYVGLDGLGFNAPVVFDNLIARQAMPVTIGIGIAPGTVTAAIASASPRFDRSFEFDSRTDRLATFVLDEVLPEVEKRTAPDGRPIRISTNPDCRMIAGSSTGAIAALNVAWQRPDAFHRVFSSIGTFVGMRGAEGFYVEVRKTEPKPIRVFLQDGAFDQWPGGPEMGDWWMSNQTMERALSFAGYDVRHAWGNGTHNGAQAAAVFPDAMQWLWRDWPSPIVAGVSSNPALQAILNPAQSWHIIAEHCPSVRLTASPSGGVVYTGRNNQPVALHSSPAACAGPPISIPMTAGADATAYIASDQDGGRIIRSDHLGSRILAGRLGEVQDLLVTPKGDIYATAWKEEVGRIWLIHPTGVATIVADHLQQPSGLALSPDKAWLFIAQGNSRYGYSFRVQPDGTLDSGEPFFDFFVPAASVGSQARSVAMDRDGRAYVATAAGVQVFDHNGRVIAILPLPGNRAASSLCFAGADFRTLYVSDGERVYARTLKVSGAPSWLPASPAPNWGAG